MSRAEIRASGLLASILATRMLGWFLILPVFSVYAAKTLVGGDNATLVGLAMGIYGLAQAFGQLPYGLASDKHGRKPVIVVGLILFALGSFVAAAATDIRWVIAGRALQGAGAISAAVTAFIADSTREEHRTKAMAMVGGSIGITFAVSMVVSPVFYQWIGMNGIFSLTGILSLAAIPVVLFMIPTVPMAQTNRVAFGQVLKNAELMRLNFGVFVLHLTQVAMFVVVPPALVQYADLPVASHWKVYLPVMVASFVLMLPPIFVAERHGKMKQVFVASIALMLIVQAGLWLFLRWPMHWTVLVALLLAFFVSFNILEASQPSLVSRIAPPAAKGAALGVYNTLQALGLACGGVLGGWLRQHVSASSVFAVGTVLTIGWLIIAANMKSVPRRGAAARAA